MGYGLALLLSLDYVGCLRAPGAFDYIERNSVAFIEGLEPFHGDGRVVYEHVTAIFSFDEAIALFRIEPFYPAKHSTAFLLHLLVQFSIFTYRTMMQL